MSSTLRFFLIGVLVCDWGFVTTLEGFGGLGDDFVGLCKGGYRTVLG